MTVGSRIEWYIKNMAKITIKKTVMTGLSDDLVIFKIPAFIARYLMDDYKNKRELTVTIAEFEAGRTLNQNNKLWALIGDIDKKLNGRRSKDGENSIYMNLVEMANIKSVILSLPAAAVDDLKARGTFRVVQVFEVIDDVATCRCYFGSSQFTKKEMIDFIEMALDYAEQVGLNSHEYDDLRG